MCALLCGDWQFLSLVALMKSFSAAEVIVGIRISNMTPFYLMFFRTTPKETFITDFFHTC